MTSRASFALAFASIAVPTGALAAQVFPLGAHALQSSGRQQFFPNETEGAVAFPSLRWRLVTGDLGGGKTFDLPLESHALKRCHNVSAALVMFPEGTVLGTFHAPGPGVSLFFVQGEKFYVASFKAASGGVLKGTIQDVVGRTQAQAELRKHGPTRLKPRIAQPLFVLNGSPIVVEKGGQNLVYYRDPAQGSVVGNHIDLGSENTQAWCHTVRSEDARLHSIMAIGPRPAPLLAYKAVLPDGRIDSAVYFLLGGDGNPRLHVRRSKGLVSVSYVQEQPPFAIGVDALWPGFPAPPFRR